MAEELSDCIGGEGVVQKSSVKTEPGCTSYTEIDDENGRCVYNGRTVNRAGCVVGGCPVRLSRIFSGGFW
ncbi:MAG: hypothetical protein KKB21_04715 [Nanoarchaeota archaeon]|nr:hypothetical protein [Nanoarchaeota archaeon]MBU4086848.1 hypothetical protein [Nanoarchaeota archaeon]